MLGGPDREKERGSVVHRGFSLDAAAVALDDAMNRRQPDSRAREIALRMQTLKGPKQLLRVSHRIATMPKTPAIILLTANFRRRSNITVLESMSPRVQCGAGPQRARARRIPPGDMAALTDAMSPSGVNGL